MTFIHYLHYDESGSGVPDEPAAVQTLLKEQGFTFEIERGIWTNAVTGVMVGVRQDVWIAGMPMDNRIPFEVVIVPSQPEEEPREEHAFNEDDLIKIVNELLTSVK